MKKVFALLVITALALSLVACGGDKTPQADSSNAATNPPAAQSPAASPAPAETPSPAPAASSSWDEWRQFLAEYEAWVDEYIVFMDKYAANPTDPALLSDYTALSAKAQEFSQRAAQVPTDLTPEQVTESSNILLRIADKLTSAAAKLS